MRTCSFTSALIAMAIITSDKAFNKIKINITPLIQKIKKKISRSFMVKEKISLRIFLTDSHNKIKSF